MLEELIHWMVGKLQIINNSYNNYFCIQWNILILFWSHQHMNGIKDELALKLHDVSGG